MDSRTKHPDIFRLAPGDIEGELISAEEAEKWVSEGGARQVVEKALLRSTANGLTGIRLFPSGQKILLQGGGEGGTVLLLSLPLRFRGILVDAFAELAGMPGPRGGISETIFQLESAAGIVSFRLSFVLGLSGPEIIVKTVPDQKFSLSMDSVGLNQDQIEITRRVLARGGGLYLLSSPGPEGVGTTLFALVKEIHRPGIRVVTVEERFRFRNEGFIQLERREAEKQFGRDWPRLAESLEPGALMIENVSDPSDFSDLIHLAQAGVAVFCGIRRFNFDRTMRTLLSLDVDPFILARVVRMVLHQRLVSLLCLECRRRVPAKPSVRMVGERYREQMERVVEESSFFVPAGCSHCRETGYSGKMALVELLPFTPAVENLVSSDVALDEKIGLLLQESFYSAVQTVHDLLRRGMVTYDDVLPFFR